MAQSMQAQKIRKWLDEWIEISHELAGLANGAHKCSIVMPIDIAAHLCSIGIFDAEQDYYKYNTGSAWVDVNPSTGNQISISMYRS